MTTTPVLSPSLGGVWMQVSPKALWIRFVGWLTSSQSEPSKEGAKDEGLYTTQIDFDPFDSTLLTSGEAAAIVNTRLVELKEQGYSLSDEATAALAHNMLQALIWE